jgi:hypothetical protein
MFELLALPQRGIPLCPAEVLKVEVLLMFTSWNHAAVKVKSIIRGNRQTDRQTSRQTDRQANNILEYYVINTANLIHFSLSLTIY